MHPPRRGFALFNQQIFCTNSLQMYQANYNKNTAADPFALTPHDYEELRGSTITPEMAERLGIFRVDDITGKQYAGKALKFGRDFAGVIFTYISPFTGLETTRRLRRDNPDIVLNSQGEEKEQENYTQHYMDRIHIYYPMLVDPEQYLAWLMDESIPIVSTEGEKKSACLFR